jgi:hypothetical protein
MVIEDLRIIRQPPMAVVRVFRFAGWAVAAMGLVGFIVVLVILGRTWSWHAGTVTASGTVRAHDAASIRTASRPTGRSGARPSYAEVVEFTDTAGARHEFRSWITTSDPFPVGAAVTVRYTPADPADAVIDTWFRVWGFPLVFAAGASLVMLVGLVFASFSRRIEHAAA